jgi:multimeric flavodoxin WrbA
MATDLTCLAFNCSLKPHGESSTQLLLDQLVEQLARHGVTTEVVRAAALDIHPGTSGDAMGPGDDWPALRQKVLDADIVVIGSPVWLGNPSSICRRVLERMDAFISETDDEGRMALFGTVGGVVAVGNEDGAHAISAQVYQALADVGVTIPAGATTYWVGEAMGSTDYKDLDETPEAVADQTAVVATNLAHLARLLRDRPYPPAPDG